MTSEQKMHRCPGCESGCTLELYQCGRGKYIYEEWLRVGGEPELKLPGGFKPWPATSRISMLLGMLSHALMNPPDASNASPGLGIINGHGGLIAPNQIAARLGNRAGEVNEIIAELEEAGYAESVEEHSMRLIQITELGRQKAQEENEQRQKRTDEFFRMLSDEEQKALLELLEKVYEPMKPARLRELDKKLRKEQNS